MVAPALNRFQTQFTMKVPPALKVCVSARM
jgi:hypothetical protein